MDLPPLLARIVQAVHDRADVEVGHQSFSARSSPGKCGGN
jgi:hypothetical protein